MSKNYCLYVVMYYENWTRLLATQCKNVDSQIYSYEDLNVSVCFRFNLDPGDDQTDPEIKESLKLAGLPDLAHDLSQVSSFSSSKNFD